MEIKYSRKIQSMCTSVGSYISEIIQIRPKVIKRFPCSTELSMKIILLIIVKMPTTVGILTFISRINIISEFFLLIIVKMPTTVGILTFISRINMTSEFFKVRKICNFHHLLVTSN